MGREVERRVEGVIGSHEGIFGMLMEEVKVCRK
jgi:hypothetical protein